MVGSSEILSKIKENLKPHPYIKVMSVVGMAGIGKTTLCKEIFNDSFELGFECRASVTIGRKYRVNELERDILVQLEPSGKMSMKGLSLKEILMGKRCLAQLEPSGKMSMQGLSLKEILKAKRCLVVLDDVWDTDILNRLERSTSLSEEIKSRVLVTTRLQEVASYFSGRLPAPKYDMRLLKKDESWDLLRERVFGEDECPRELEKDGKKIAEKCDGLPLTIVIVANLLSQAHKTAEYWKSVAENKKSSIFMAAYDQMYEVLFPSYEYLPQHLKPCFLHMGVFPLNYEISKSNLLCFWVVEGFIEPNGKRKLENYAHMYLGKLFDNSVIIRCQTSTNFPYKKADDVKACRLQAAFWHLCYREATKSKFFHILTSLDDGVEENMKSQHYLNHIDALSELRSLKCVVMNPKMGYEIVTLRAPQSMFPLNLKKLHLSGLGYPWEFMSIIGSLPNLQVLKLLCYAFRGPKWEVKAGEFKFLDYLLVEGTDLVQFKVEYGAFGWLGSLCLKHCYKLEDFQWNGGTSYMKIEVTDCSPSTEKFANKMRSIYPDCCEAFVHSSLKDGKLK